jgi:phosphate uptake regulator
MWKELMEIFRGGEDPLKVMADEFMEMLRITHDMAVAVNPHIYDHSLDLEGRRKVSELDVKVNTLERTVRKRIVAHLSLDASEVSFCLQLMLLVKDAERLGDYVKNIADVSELGGAGVPAGALRTELEDLVGIAMQLFHETPRVIADQNRERAEELLVIERNAAKRSDKLVVAVAESHHTAAEVTSMVLLTRFHKRIASHLANILSSVVRPVHRVAEQDEPTTGPQA